MVPTQEETKKSPYWQERGLFFVGTFIQFMGIFAQFVRNESSIWEHAQ